MIALAVVFVGLPDKAFDGELCHVVQSKVRREMLLISKASGLLRGDVLIDPSGYLDEFYKSEEPNNLCFARKIVVR